MSVSTIAAPPKSRGNGWFAIESLAQSTSTTAQALALTTETTELSGGTATGFGVNQFSLSTASAVEGQEKVVLMTGTGEAKIVLGGGTATGRWVLGEADDILHAKFLSGKWRVISNSGATLATST